MKSIAHYPSTLFSTRRDLLLSFLLIFIPTSILLSAVFFAFTRLTRDYELQTTLIREASAIKSSCDFASLLVEQKLSDLLVLAEGETLRKFLHEDNTNNWIHLAREFILFARRKPQYAQIRFIDLNGLERVRVNNVAGEQMIVPKSELQDKSHRYYFERSISLSQGEIYVSPMDLNIEQGKIVLPYEPTIRFATPVYDGYGAKRGIVILNYRTDKLLSRLAELSTQMTGQTLLLNPDGHWLMGAPEEKLWGFMFNRSDTFAAEYRNAWTTITNNDNGTYMSDEGIFVFRKAFLLNHENLGTPENLPSINQNLTAHFDDHFWILVSHISNSMIDELASKRAIVSSGAYITLFLVTSLISYLFARNSVQKKLAYRQLEERAIKDDLTGAANRRELNRVGKREFLRATRFGHPLSMLMLDLDHFKQVNDSFGHDIGDLVLKHVTGICQSTIREQDLLSRFGGEEFVILMPETDIEGAKQLADRLCTNVRTYPYLHRTKEISLTVSIGISSCIDGDPDYRHILVRADKALYQAKINGRDRVEVLT